jgi:hypothetical protein
VPALRLLRAGAIPVIAVWQRAPIVAAQPCPSPLFLLGRWPGALREFNDEELRRWVEVEKKTQAEIAKLVGRSQGRISQRCSALGIVSGRTSSGQRRSISPNTSAPSTASTDGPHTDFEEVLVGSPDGASSLHRLRCP